MTWSAPSWPRREELPPLDPQLRTLADAVDAFLSGALTRDGLQKAWQLAVGRRSR